MPYNTSTTSSSRKVSTKEKTSAPGKAPSYRHADKQTGENDETSDHESEVAEELSAEDSDSEKQITVSASKKKTSAIQPGGKGTKTDKKKQSSDSADVEKKIPIGFLLLRPAYKIGKNQVTEPDASSFVPSSYMLDEILHAMHLCTGENQYVYRANPQYHILLSRLYYGIMFHYQILRCKRAAGQATSKEKTFMTNFEDEYPLESLPCAGPLTTYFSALAAYKPDDPMYNWVHPTFPSPPGRTVATDFHSTDKRELKLPFIAGILSMIEIMKSGKAKTDDKTKNYIDDATDIWYPLRLYNDQHPDDDATFAGIRFDKPGTSGTKLKLEHYEAIVRSGLVYPPEMGPDSIEQRRSYLKKMRQIPKPTTDDVYPTVPHYLYLDDDMSWFCYCVSAATTESNFFLGSQNFSNITFVSGPAITVSTIQSDLKKPSKSTNQGFYSKTVCSNSGTIQTRVGSATPDDLAIGQFCQFHSRYPSNTFGSYTGMRSSRVNDTGSFDQVFYKDPLVQIESSKAANMANELENTVRVEIFVAKGIENHAK